MDLAGRGVAVTGGGGHLGRAMSLALAEAGATVVACGRTAERLEAVAAEGRERGLAGRIVPVVADVSTDAGLGAVIGALEREAETVSGWVNNAYAGTSELLGSLTRAGIESALGGGLIDVMLATQAVAERMSSGGSIVNIASMYGLVSPQPAAYAATPAMHNPPAYGAAKAGVVSFTRYAAVHLAERGIRVNCISPGAFPGEAVQEDAAFVAELAGRTPLGRIGRPEELGGAVVYLVGDASSFVTGANLVVDGGWTAW